MSDTIAPGCYAIYDRASRRIVSFQWVTRPPTLPGHPELDFRQIDGPPPPFAAKGYLFDDAFTLIPG